MTAWHERPFLSIDTETTGVDIHTDRIVEIATAMINPDGTVEHEWATVVDPKCEIPAEAADIHGITTERARAEGVQPEVALRRVARYMATNSRCPVVVYNARFDLPLILNEAARHGVEILTMPLVLDPFVIDKALDKYRKGSRKLIDVARHYGVVLDEADAHGALADCIASGRLMHRILADDESLTECTLTRMFLWQSSHAEDQRASFVAYKRRTDPEFSSPAGWPLPVRAA